MTQNYSEVFPQQRNSSETQFSGQKVGTEYQRDKSITSARGKFHQVIMHHIECCECKCEGFSSKTFAVHQKG